MLQRLKNNARKIKINLYALYLAYKDKRTPWYARLIAALVVAYAFSPIDLIPDFIPIIGIIDDLILLPLGIYLAVKAIPVEIFNECIKNAEEEFSDASKPKNWFAGILIILIWILISFLIIYKIFWD